ncbi:sensor domain-containing diguanylate cyclase [Roseococcus sp. SYP-B2431]|uniref:sensor domain-containing diguanylate cyclase n=1 Tax=Roseococcus sp. SYP-B2431 TaxID=2496640 RepID=UPI0013F3DEC8|nr:sensor domain-containing diguanylate cyclase [Roseococcus sp. SYP-B2431]
MTTNEPSDEVLRQGLDAYTAWVSALRQGKDVPPPVADGDNPLARLGRELQLLSETISRREAELSRLNQVVLTAEREILVEDVLDSIFRGFVGIIPYDRIGCAFLSSGGTRLTSFWARSNMGPMRINKGYSRPLVGSSLREVFRTGEPRILNDLEQHLARHPASDATRNIVAEGGRSSLTCPLFVDGRPLGVLFFTSHQTNVYRDIHQAVFRQIAGQVAVLINKSKLFQELVERNQFLLRQAEQLQEAANRDPLTGVLNRRAFLLALERHMRAGAASGKTLGLVLADIDHFKSINDTHGHAAGDEALRAFTARIGGLLRPGDYLGRYGGEEFLILIGDTPAADLPAAVERYRAAIADDPFDLGGVIRPITASFGIAVVSDAESTPEEIVAIADRALYEAKAGGRNRVVLAAASGHGQAG